MPHKKPAQFLDDEWTNLGLIGRWMYATMPKAIFYFVHPTLKPSQKHKNIVVNGRPYYTKADFMDFEEMEKLALGPYKATNGIRRFNETDDAYFYEGSRLPIKEGDVFTCSNAYRGRSHMQLQLTIELDFEQQVKGKRYPIEDSRLLYKLGNDVGPKINDFLLETEFSQDVTLEDVKIRTTVIL